MRYLKVLFIVLIFFVSMVFFFQNQATLSTQMVLHLNLFFIEPMQSISLPFYFLVLAAFLLGALASMLALVWDKVQLSTKFMKANWRVRSLEKEVEKLKAAQSKNSVSTGFLGTKSVAKSSASNAKKSEFDDIAPPDPDKQI